MPADLVLKNGKFYTQAPDEPPITAVAIQGDRVIATGDDLAVSDLISASGKTVDLDGQCVIPGLVDAHAHFRSFALGLQRIDLHGITSLGETLEEVANYGTQLRLEGWLLGRGWNQADWVEPHFPTKHDLDRVIADQPVFLKHRSGHAAWVNSKALELADILPTAIDPPGGQILRAENGAPSGILLERAVDLVTRVVPRPSNKEVAGAMRAAQELCLKAGLTGIHDFDSKSCFSALQTLHGREQLRLRFVKNFPVKYLDHIIGLGLTSGFGDTRLRIGGIKIFADGALGPQTAAVIEPYENSKDNYGIMVTDQEEIIEKASLASSNGLSVTIHAIGDRANHQVLNVFKALRQLESKDHISNRPHHRHRIEHAQLLHPGDISRFASLGVVASMQPIHATADMEMADRYWGERARYSYAWRSLLNEGTVLAFGSDAPVEDIDPLMGIYAAASRKRPGGILQGGGWRKAECLTVAEAVYAYTMGPAYTSSRENILGSIQPGKLADFTIFDRDIFQVPVDEILDIQIAGTVIGGIIEYQNW